MGTAASKSGSEIIIQAMEQVAEQAGDITPTVFARYFERCRESRALMDHMDEHMLGRMMDQVLLLLMESGEAELQSYLAFETAAHRSYGVEQHMYENLLAAVLEVISASLGDGYSREVKTAFDNRVGLLLKEIEAAALAHDAAIRISA